MNLFVSVLALVGWALWGYTVLFVDPGAPFARLVFYGGLYVALTCTLARLLESPGYEDLDGVLRPPKPGLGHAASLATLLLFALWLQSLRMLTALNGSLLLLTFGLIELGFRLSGSRPRPKARRRPRRPTLPETSRSGDR
jgi:hypothetical protein